MKIAVVGAGAVGLTFAAHLWKAGHRDLVLCARRVVASYRVETASETITLPLATTVNPESVSTTDWVLLATKTYQTHDAVPWLARACGPKTRVVVLQNGIDQIERVAPLVGPAKVIPTSVLCPAERVAPGHVIQRGPAHLILPEAPESRELAGLFVGSQAICEMKADFVTALWEKLVGNLLGAVMAITEERLGVLQRPDMVPLARGLLTEAAAVARAEGAAIASDFVEQVLRAHESADPEAGTSILYDRLAGRPLEYAARNEVIVQRGQRHGIAVPLNEAIVALLRAISARAERLNGEVPPAKV